MSSILETDTNTNTSKGVGTSPDRLGITWNETTDARVGTATAQ